MTDHGGASPHNFVSENEADDEAGCEMQSDTCGHVVYSHWMLNTGCCGVI